MTVEKIPNHSDRAVGLLIDQFKNKPDLEALVRIYVDEIQLLEDAFWEFIAARDVDTSTGESLRFLGKKVGRRFAGEEQETFRLLVKTQILINRSHGKWRDLNAVATALFGSLPGAWNSVGPKNTEFRPSEALTSRPAQEQRLLESSAHAGVRVDIAYSVDADNELDRFAFGAEGGGFEDSGLLGGVSSIGT